MAKVEWAEDYGQYKKGDQFEAEGETLSYLLDSKKVRLVKSEKTETATAPKAETAEYKKSKK